MRFTFRTVERDDTALLARWMAAPHVAVWWREASELATVESMYSPSLEGDDPTDRFLAVYDGQPIGFVQRYRLADYPDWRLVVSVAVDEEDVAGIDYFIGVPELVGRGLGTEMISQFTEEVWQDWGDVSTIVVSVQEENAASSRALEKAHFTRVWSGVLDSDDPSDAGPSVVYVRRRPPDDETIARRNR